MQKANAGIFTLHVAEGLALAFTVVNSDLPQLPSPAGAEQIPGMISRALTYHCTCAVVFRRFLCNHING